MNGHYGEAFILRVHLSGAAFEENLPQALGELLERAGEQVKERRESGVIRDTNGNQVGAWGYE